MISYEKLTVEEFFPTVKGLIDRQYEELVVDKDVLKLDINVDIYKELETLGITEFHVIKDNGIPIGFQCWLISKHLFYKSSLIATAQSLYIAPEYRKGLFAFKFLKWTIDEIKKHKPQQITMPVTSTIDHGALLERLGAVYFEKHYSIILE
jgi:hypothetical protein